MTTARKYSIVYVANNAYLEPLLASLRSFRLNSGLYGKVDITVIHTEDLQLEKLTSFNVKSIIIKEPCLKFTREWGLNPASKFEVFKIKGYKKILYLDCDTIIQKDISDIFLFKGDFLITALKKIKGVIYNGTQKGFNAGVMVIGKKYLKQKVYDELVELSKRNNFTGNQNALNFYFKDKLSIIPLPYNTCLDQLRYVDRKEIKILHYIEYKPWLNKSTEYIDKHIGIIEKYLLKRIYYRYV